MKKFLIGQLACYGDCLYATTIAKQIRNDYPDSHITWAVSSNYRSILEMNPDIDKIWEIEIPDKKYYTSGWKNFKKQALQKQKKGEFDEIIFSQIPPDNWKNYTGTVRHTIVSSYRKPITVPVDPVVRLSQQEIGNVKRFAEKHALKQYKEVVLFECAPGNGQSDIDIESAVEIAEEISKKHTDVCFVISSAKPLQIIKERIVDASGLSYRENAELTNYCTLLIGCSSGITWLTTSDWAKKLPMIQILNRRYPIYVGLSYEFEMWNLDNRRIIEMLNPAREQVFACIDLVWREGFIKAKEKYHESYLPSYENFKSVTAGILGTYNIFSAFKMIFTHNKFHQHLKKRVLFVDLCITFIKVYWGKFLRSPKKFISLLKRKSG